MEQIKCFPDAVANIKGSNSDSSPCGQIKFYQRKNCVLISINISCLPTTTSGFFGFHIHEGANCKGENFSGTGNHYNPANTPHPNHAGDLPPLMLCNGGAFQTVATDRFNVEEIIGRTVVIHNMPDDFNSQPSGNAGTKIACGVICKAYNKSE